MHFDDLRLLTPIKAATNSTAVTSRPKAMIYSLLGSYSHPHFVLSITSRMDSVIIYVHVVIFVPVWRQAAQSEDPPHVHVCVVEHVL